MEAHASAVVLVRPHPRPRRNQIGGSGETLGEGPPRVLCVTNMFPGPSDPDYGVFVSDMARRLELTS